MLLLQVGEAITRGKAHKVTDSSPFLAFNSCVQIGPQDGALPKTTLLVHLFGESGKRKLYIREFTRFVVRDVPV